MFEKIDVALFIEKVATTDYTPCEVGEHAYVLEETKDTYGGRYTFTVSSCPYSKTEHEHDYVTGTLSYLYVCSRCGNTKIVEKTYLDANLGAFCLEQDVGR